jgi:hypothetical protein
MCPHDVIWGHNRGLSREMGHYTRTGAVTLTAATSSYCNILSGSLALRTYSPKSDTMNRKFACKKSSCYKVVPAFVFDKGAGDIQEGAAQWDHIENSKDGWPSNFGSSYP